jgi:hypothetical protein
MCFALGGEQFPGLADHLLEYGHAKSPPQTFAIGVGHPRQLRPRHDNDRVRQRWNTIARKGVHLLEGTGDSRGSESRRIDAPTVREDTHRAIGQNTFVKPGNQHRCAGRGMDGVHKRVFPSASK